MKTLRSKPELKIKWSAVARVAGALVLACVLAWGAYKLSYKVGWKLGERLVEELNPN